MSSSQRPAQIRRCQSMGTLKASYNFSLTFKTVSENFTLRVIVLSVQVLTNNRKKSFLRTGRFCSILSCMISCGIFVAAKKPLGHCFSGAAWSNNSWYRVSVAAYRTSLAATSFPPSGLWSIISPQRAMHNQQYFFGCRISACQASSTDPDGEKC